MPNIIFRFFAFLHACVIAVSLTLLAIGLVNGWQPRVSKFVGFAWLFEKTANESSCQVKQVGVSTGGHATWMPCEEWEKRKRDQQSPACYISNSYCESDPGYKQK